MEPTSVWLTETQFRPKEQLSENQLLPPSHEVERTLEVQTDAIKRPTSNLIKSPLFQREEEKRATPNTEHKGLFRFQNFLPRNTTIAEQPTVELQPVAKHQEIQTAEDLPIEHFKTAYIPAITQIQAQSLVQSTPNLSNSIYKNELEITETLKLQHTRTQGEKPN